MDAILDTLLALADSPWVLALVFAFCVLDGFFPPIPSEPLVIALAALALPNGGLGLLPLLGAASAGAVVGDNIAYWIGTRARSGRWGSPGSTTPLRRAWEALSRRPRVVAAVRRARSGLAQRGASLILTARYIPVGRTAVNVTAGAMAYPWRRFLGLSVLGGIGWALYSVFIGSAVARVLGNQPVLAVVVAIVIAIVLGTAIDWILRRISLRRDRQRATPPAAVPAE